MLISEGAIWICWNFMLDIGEVNCTELDLVILDLFASLLSADLLKNPAHDFKGSAPFLNVIMVRGNHFCDQFCQRQQKHRSAQREQVFVVVAVFQVIRWKQFL